MANTAHRETPKPRYSGTVVCPHCHAEYKPGNWWRGYYEGTSDQFNPTSKITGCPVCLHESS